MADNNVINIAKNSTAQKVSVTVGNLEPNASAEIRILHNGNQDIDIPANSFTGNSLSTEIIVTDRYQQTATATSTAYTFTFDTRLNTPSVTLLSIADNNQINAAKQALTNLPLKLSVAKLDSDAQVLIEIFNGSIKIAEKTVTQAGEITLPIAKGLLAQSGSLTAKATVSDHHGNQLANNAVTVAPLAYTVKTTMQPPSLRITEVAGDNVLSSSKLNQTVKVEVSNLKQGASGQLTLKIGNQTIITQSTSNGDETLNLTGEQLRRGSVLLTGRVDLKAELQPGFTPLQPNLNQGDVWRWADSVTFTFENGITHTVPVTHQDPDGDRFTVDPNSVEYALSLTATQWKKVSEKAFKITVNRLKDRDGNDFETVFYLNDAQDNGIFRENASKDGKAIQKLDIQVIPYSNKDVTASNNSDYPYKLAKYDPKTIITGIAGGSDVAVGDVVNIQIGNNTTPYTVKLDENK